MVCVGVGRKPECWFFHDADQIISGCDEIRECSVEVLLEVSCFNPRILNNLQGWYYHFRGNVRPDLEYRMEVLRTEFNTKFTTIIHPFVKKYKPLENRKRLE